MFITLLFSHPIVLKNIFFKVPQVHNNTRLIKWQKCYFTFGLFVFSSSPVSQCWLEERWVHVVTCWQEQKRGWPRPSAPHVTERWDTLQIVIVVVMSSPVTCLTVCLWTLQGRALSRAKSRRNLDFQDVLDKLADKGIAIRVASPKLVMEEVRNAPSVIAF